MPRRLAQKLMLSLTVIVVIVAAVSGILHIKSEERQLVNAMTLGADQLSRSITSATWHAMLADHRENVYQIMQTIALKQGIDRIRIFNRSGKVMFSTRPEDNATEATKNSETCALCHASSEPLVNVGIGSRTRIFHRADGSRGMAMVTPIYNEPACSQAACHAHPAAMKILGVLDLSLNLEPVDHEIADVKLRVALVTGIQILLIAVFIYFFTRHFLAVPIRQLIEGTKAVSAMDLDKPVRVTGSSEELGELSRSFNAMRERLRAAMAEINEFTQSLETKVEQRTAQLKAAHQKLMQTDRLASLGQLSASVAHEINNPISGVLNLGMLMQRILKDDGIPPERIPEFRKYLGQLVNETARVGRIVSDLLAFSRRSKPQRAPADLNRIVRSTLSLVSHRLKLSNVEAELDLREDLPAVFCDSSQMQQVVLNLLMNGAEATQGHGSGRVSVRTRLAAGGGGVELRGARQRRGHPAGEPGQNLHAVLYDQARGQGRGAGAGGGVRDCGGARRRGGSGERAGRGRHVHREAAADAGGRGRAGPAV